MTHETKENIKLAKMLAELYGKSIISYNRYGINYNNDIKNIITGKIVGFNNTAGSILIKLNNINDADNYMPLGKDINKHFRTSNGSYNNRITLLYDNVIDDSEVYLWSSPNRIEETVKVIGHNKEFIVALIEKLEL